ncbi:MAG TPA: GMC family oxidoreductase [Kofleriaceae bacterium]
MALANRSDDLDRLGNDIDVIVIGSGYGAGVCAARLAQAGAKVVILERGREFSVSSERRFPSTPQELRNQVQIDGGPFGRSHRLGLYNFHIHRDLDALVGCGLGGTSLINANVVIKPDPGVFQRAMWPARIRAEAGEGTLDAYYRRSHGVLDPAQYPATQPTPRKLAVMEAHGAQRCSLNVHFKPDKHNSVGVPQDPCNSCGDCVTGCNFQAKKTLCFTYLPIAKSYGAQIFVQCDVDRVAARDDGRWDVHFQRLKTGSEPVEAAEKLTARAVIVGAGVLGTAGILLRSRDRGLALSPQLGKRFSGNGDAIAFAYNCDQRIDSVGHGQAAAPAPPVGPTILAVIDQRGGVLDDGIIMQEGAFPSGMAHLLRLLMQTIAGCGAETQHGFLHWFRERISEANDLFGDTRDGALNRTLMLFCIGHDGADGVLELDAQHRAAIRWPELHSRNLFTAENALVRAIAGKLGGMFVKDPLNTPLFLNNLITVHPLGGCPMGDDSAGGVVDDAGRVFRDDGRRHAGLYVSDASVIPTSLGANPLWTISSLAERIADHATADLGFTPAASPTLAAGVVIQP